MKTILFSAAQFTMTALVFVYVGLLLHEIKRSLATSGMNAGKQRTLIKKIVFALVAWFLFSGIWALSGKMEDFSTFPLNVGPVLFIPLITLMIVIFSKTTGMILSHIPPYRLIRLQSFRLFVELALWALFIVQQLPEQMTLEGRNFDILVGITAIPVSILAYKNKITKPVLIAWNVAGLCLLINIVTIAILSMPSPLQRFMEEPANTIITKFPFVVLPAFLVPLAYTLHLLSLRQLLAPALPPGQSQVIASNLKNS